MDGALWKDVVADADEGRTSGRARQRHRASQDPQQQSCRGINQEIIAAADSGDTSVLLATIQGRLPLMNLVNLSTSLHRLAKLTAASPEEQQPLRQHPAFTGLLCAVHAALLRGEDTGAAPQTQAISNIVWSCATLQCVDKPLLVMVASLAHKHAAAFKSFELTTVLWALAKLSTMDAELAHYAAAIFQYAVSCITNSVGQFTFRCLVMAAWSFATVGCRDCQLFSSMAGQMLQNIHTSSCQELANTAWAFGTAVVHHEELFVQIAGKAAQSMASFKASELSSILWSFANNGFIHDEFLDGASDVVKEMDLQPRQQATVLWALSWTRPRHQATQAAALALLPKCTRTLDDFSEQEVASIALAAARSFGRDLEKVSPIADASARPPLPPSVAEFFEAAWLWSLPRLAELPGQALANVATAFLQIRDEDDIDQYEEFFLAIGLEVANRVSRLESSVLVLLLRDLPGVPKNTCGAVMRALFREAARRTGDMQPQDLQALSRICAGLLGCQNGFLSKEMLRGCCLSLAEASMWDSSKLSSDNSQAPDSDYEEAVEVVRAKTCGQTASTASTCSDDEEGAKTKLPDFPLCYFVKNTFVDIGDSDSSDASDTELTLKPLDAPLDILPRDISTEKLEAYRISYQKFRVGCAAGARGELTSISV